MSSKNIHDEISRCIIQMLVDEPFYAHFLSGIVRKVTDEVPTAAVGLNKTKVTLYVNESFFLKELTTFSSRVAVIKHETLHLIFKHLFRFDFKKYNVKILNISADLVVNQFVGKWKLPSNAVTLKSFPELELNLNESVEYYYEKLIKLNKKQKKNTSKKNLDGILNQKTHSDHSKWMNSEDYMSNHAEKELDRIIEQTRNRITLEQFKLLPESLRERINLIIQTRKPRVNWKRALKIFSSSSRRTKVKFSSKRISKRYGTRPGIIIKRNQKLLVAIDTSGSINMDEYAIFFSEIHSMWINGAEIEIVECDAQIQRSYMYLGKLPEFIKGGGWTSFDPVFNYINNKNSYFYNGCIYLTDGLAAEPIIKPRCKVFWVISPHGEVGPHLKYGRVVKIHN